MKINKKINIEFIILTVCVFLALGYIAFSVRKSISETEKEIRILVKEAATNVRSYTTLYNRHLQLLRSGAEELLIDNYCRNENIKNRLINIKNKGWELIPNTNDSLTFIGRLTGIGLVNDLSKEEVQEIYMAEKLNKLFAQTNNNLPNAPFIYYTSKANFWNITPRHTEDFSFFRQDYYSYELYTLGLPQNNPLKNVFWTKPYIDAGGNGLMVSAGIPFYDHNKFKGTICIDMLFNDIADYIKSNAFANLDISLVDNYSQIVSSTIQQLAPTGTIPTLHNLINDTRNNIELFELNKFVWYKSNRIFISKIPNTQWYILQFETRSKFLIDIIEDILPIFAAVLFLLVIIYLLLYANRLRIESEKAKIKAEKANSTKDKFLSIITHDLRGPFVAILGFSDLIHDNINNYSTEKKNYYFGIIHKQIQTFYKLLENLLVWVQLQKDGISYNPEKLSLCNLVNETIEPLYQLAQNKLIKISNEIPNDLKVESDRSILNTIIRNLVSNAIKFTHENGIITISAVQKGRFAEIYVKDNGIGITKDKLDKLFDISQMTSTIGTNGESGTGLGLMLCKELVELQRGKIWVYSKVGQGSEFIFTSPYSL